MSRWPLLALGLWGTAIAGGLYVLERHANTPGQLAEAPLSWPAQIEVERASGQPTLVMLAHPRCPCTRASLAELARLMADIGGEADAIVLFADPAGTDWERTDLWRQAEQIPGVRAMSDPDSHLAQQFGAHTSGQVVVYDEAGALLFNGGITASRGHQGDNAGRSAIASLLSGSAAPANTAAVFGCELETPRSTE